MGRPNYKAEKRRRELDRQKKQEAKREKRLLRTEDEDGNVAAGGDAGSDSVDADTPNDRAAPGGTED